MGQAPAHTAAQVDFRPVHPRSTAGCAAVPGPTPARPSGNGQRPPPPACIRRNLAAAVPPRALKERCRSTTGCRVASILGALILRRSVGRILTVGHHPRRPVASLLAHGAQVPHTGSVSRPAPRTPGTPRQKAPNRCVYAPAAPRAASLKSFPVPANGHKLRRPHQIQHIPGTNVHPNRRKTSPNISRLGRMEPSPASAGAVCRLTLRVVVIRETLLLQRRLMARANCFRLYRNTLSSGPVQLFPPTGDVADFRRLTTSYSPPK